MISPGVMLGALLLVCAAGLLIWAIRGDRARGRQRCPRCWYDMVGSQSLTCPECGHEAASERSLFRTRRRWRWGGVAMVLLVLSGTVHLGDRYRTGGWPALPRIAVLLYLPWGDLRPAGGAAQDEYINAFAPLSQMSIPYWQERWIVRVLGRRLVGDRQAEARMMAGIYLNGMRRNGADISPAIPAVLQAFEDIDPEVENIAAMLLVESRGDDEVFDELWVQLLLQGRTHTSRSFAANVLGRRMRAGQHQHLPTLLAAMQKEFDGPYDWRRTAAGAISQAIAYSRSSEALGAFLELLEAEDPFKRFVAARSIEIMGEFGAPATSALIRNIQADASFDSLVFIRAIGAIGPEAREAIPTLIAGMDHPEHPYGHRCIWALGRVGIGDDRAVEALTGALASTRYGYVHQALEALAYIGFAAERERSSVELLAGSEDPGLRIWAKLILARADGAVDAFVDEMMAGIQGDRLEIWDLERAIAALGLLGPAAQRAVPLLEQIYAAEGEKTSELNWRKRAAAEQALAAIRAEGR